MNQFLEDLVLQLHSGTQTDTTDNQVYYYNGTNWVSFADDNQNISGSSFDGNVLTIGIENGDNETIDLSPVKDNLGNHTATNNINLNGNYLSSDGDNEGVFVDSNGNVGVGKNNPNVKLDVNGKEQNTNIRVSISSDTAVTTSSKTFVDLPEMSVDVTTAASDLLILLDIPGITNTGSDEEIFFRIMVDDTQIGGFIDTEDAANLIWSSSMQVIAPVSAGTHTVKVQWMQQGWSTSHVASINSNNSTYKFPRVLTVIEL